MRRVSRPPQPFSPSRVRRAVHEVRLIGGLWKRSKLPVADRPGLRPTPDRVRETLFNWLGQDLSGWSVLDAFAGSGALGFEAASRGATRVVLIEQDAELIGSLRQTASRLGATQVEVVRADALGWMRRSTQPVFDLVLLDPPFSADLFDAALRDARACLSDTGWIYLESDQAWSEERLAALDLVLHRCGRAGVVHFHLLGRRPPPAPAVDRPC